MEYFVANLKKKNKRGKKKNTALNDIARYVGVMTLTVLDN